MFQNGLETWGRYLKKPEELYQLKLRGNPGVLKGYEPDVHEVCPEKFFGLAKANHAQVTISKSTLSPFIQIMRWI